MDEEVLDLSVPRGHMETWTWSQIELGNIVRDKKDRMHTIIEITPTTVAMQAARTDEVAVITRPPADRPVDVYVPSERECVNLLWAEVGASFLRDIEDREHTLTRALLWRLDPVPASASSLRDHIDLIHGGMYVDVYLSRHDTAKTEAAAGRAAHDTERTKKANAKARVNLKELQACHDELHSDAHLWPMAFPHHHAAIN